MRKRKRRRRRIGGGGEGGCVRVSVYLWVCGGGARDDQRVGETFSDPGKD